MSDREGKPKRDPEKAKEYRRRYALAHPDREKARHKRYRTENAEKRREYNKEWSARNRAKLHQLWREWKTKNREKYLAERMANENIPLKEKCEICGAKARDRHHEDYSKPLEVIHVCSKCHRKLDRERRIA